MAASIPAAQSSTLTPLQSISLSAQLWMLPLRQAARKAYGNASITRKHALHTMQLYSCAKLGRSPLLSYRKPTAPVAGHLCLTHSDSFPPIDWHGPLLCGKILTFSIFSPGQCTVGAHDAHDICKPCAICTPVVHCLHIGCVRARSGTLRLHNLCSAKGV